ncbi:DNA excision repair protein ERCC-6-like [Ptychodera flava]|uniref:DNA excision repair protein ERCC-6-like n=1 Tax=Ptychodera flava TaxID=63121 RepID=UPI00396A88B4
MESYKATNGSGKSAALGRADREMPDSNEESGHEAGQSNGHTESEMNTGTSTDNHSDPPTGILARILTHGRSESQGNMDSELTTQPSTSGSTSSKTDSVLHINTTLIPQVPSSQQSEELQGLGVDVYSHAEFEQNVMQQVDQAILKREQEMQKKQAERELSSVLEDIRSSKERLFQIKRALSNVPKQNANKEVQRLLISMTKQKDNKERQLKKLRARKRYLISKMGDGAVGLEDSEASDEGDVDDSEMSAFTNLLSGSSSGGQPKETEQERLIRLGEMTPFGTRIDFANTPNKQTAKKPPIVRKPTEMTDFEKFLMGQDKQAEAKRAQKTVTPKKKVKKTDDPTKIKSSKKLKSSEGEQSHARNEETQRSVSPKLEPCDEIDDRRIKFLEKRRNSSKLDLDRLERGRMRGKRRWKNSSSNWMSDDESDFDYEDDDDYGDEEYIPDEDELRGSWKHDDYTPARQKKSKRATHLHDSKQKMYSDDHNDEDDEWEDASGLIRQDTADDSYGLDDIKRSFGVRARPSKSKAFRKCADDANIEQYEKRLRKYKKQQLEKKKARIEAGESESEEETEDYEFDGGYKVPGQIWNRLYKYQKVGVQWLWELHGQQVGGIVGDEMGLGKTIQIIAFLAGLKYSKLPIKGDKYVGLGPVLIVCPTTVMHQWLKEFHAWYPSFRVAIFHDSGSYSGSKQALVYDVVKSRSVLVTSYSGIRIHQDLLLRYQWDYVILDEGHKIRNPDAEVTMACKQFRTPHRLILSGSPMQNNLRELWSLCDFVFPGKLGTLPVFMQEFSVPITMGGYSNASEVQVKTAYKCACVLRDTINPYLLRRMKEDVKMNLSLPNKNEQVLFCRLTPEQVDVYKEYLDSKECNMILAGRYQVFAGLITLRKICNHPDLSTGGPKILVGEYKDDDDIPEERQFGFWKKSGKMIVVESLLKLWKKQQHRVLLFSQSKQMLDVLETFVRCQGYKYMRMDGSTPISSRQPAINTYNNDPSIFVFLLTTRVGGLGVNLTGADRVVIFDPDWNPSTDMQARERAWRIGQTKHVTIYRLLTTGTIEEKIYHRQIFKQFLTNRVLKDPKQRRFFKTNDLYELFSLGAQDNDHGTETSAIFAGTGSNVNVDLKKSKVSDRGHRQNGLKRSHTQGQVRGHDIAEKKPKLRRSETAPGEIHSRSSDGKVHKASGKADEKSGGNQDGSIKEEETVCSTEEKSPKMADIPKVTEDVTEVVAPSGSSIKEEMTSCTQDDQAREAEMSSVHGELDEETQLKEARLKLARKIAKRLAKGKHSTAKSSRIDRQREKLKKMKKKRKKKDAVLEGEKISYLDRHNIYEQEADEDDKANTNIAQDDYVLQKLFKKSGVHSALQHDNIMQAAHPDYILVEGEAERVAKEAADALKQSRRQCRTRSIGVPTWTGQSGAAGAPKAPAKPRFGQKVNGKFGAVGGTLVKKRTPASTLEAGKGKLFGKKKHFDGAVSGNIERDAAMPASSDLLAKMRERNHVILDADVDSFSDSDEGAGGSTSVPIREKGEKDELLEELRCFIAFQASVNGQASTDELLTEFKDKLAHKDSVYFKAMLRQICTFHRNSEGVGMWRLRAEYR